MKVTKSKVKSHRTNDEHDELGKLAPNLAGSAISNTEKVVDAVRNHLRLIKIERKQARKALKQAKKAAKRARKKAL